MKNLSLQKKFFKDKFLFKFYKNISKIFILALFINADVFSFNYFNIRAEELFNTSEYIRKIPKENFYILGKGDSLNLSFTNNNDVLPDILLQIDGEGTIYLKRLKRIYVAGLTIKELEEILNKEYSEFLRNPNVQLSVIRYRPVEVFIDGEIKNPGIYVIDRVTDNVVEENKRNRELGMNKYFLPSLIDVIRTSGGLTSYADLENIEIIRKNNISNGSGRLKTNINLIKSFQFRSDSQNVRIMDGDRIFIPRSEKQSLSQISKVIKSNLNPRVINVYVGGRVEERPGLIKISSSSVLTDAIASVGGTKALKGKVQFIRSNNDGTVDKRIFNYDKNAKRGTYKNPLLENGDIIYVGKSKFNLASEIITGITAPFKDITTTYFLIDSLN